MITRVTIVAKNNEPMSVLGDNPNEKVKAAWEIALNFIALRNGETVNVESAEVWDNEPQTERDKTTDDYEARALEMALNDCKAKHNGCNNCTRKCMWRD